MIRDIRWSAVGHVVSMGASLVTAPLLARALAPTGYGLYKSAFFVAALLLVLGNLNVNTLLRKAVPQADAEMTGGLLSATLLFVNLPVALAVVGLWLLLHTDLIAQLVSSGFETFAIAEFPLFALLVWVTLFYSTVDAALTSQGRYPRRTTVQVLAEGLFLVAVLALAFTGTPGLESLLFAYIGARVVAIVIALKSVAHTLTWPAFGTFFEQFRSVSVPLLPTTVAKQVGTKVPDAVVVAAFGPATFAAWTIAFAFNYAFLALGKPVSDVLLPRLSERVADGRRLDGTFRRYYRVMGLLCLPLVVGGWLVGTDIVRYVFGSGYVLPGLVVPLLVTAFGLQTVNTLAAQHFVATDAERLETTTRVSQYGLRAIFALVGAFVFDSLLVIALGFLLGTTLRTGVAGWYQSRTVGLPSLDVRSVASVAGGLLAMGVVVLVGRSYVDGTLDVILLVGAGGVVYFSTLYLSGMISDTERRMLHQLTG